MGLVLLLTLVVYLPALNGGLLWDDDSNLTRSNLQSLPGLYRIWFDPAATSQYYPLVHTAFWLEHTLWGDALLGYHLVSLFWHLLSIVLVYLILEKLKIPGALFAAAIFAVHPVMVESVAWITEQRNTLSTVFYLGAVLSFLQFDESRRRLPYFGALALSALALATKTVTATLPVAILVILWWQRGALSWRRDVWPLVPFFALSIAMGLMTIWVERKFIGAQGPDFELTYPARFLLAGHIIWFYLAKIFWPSNLTFIYPRWTIDPGQWWQWIYPIAALTATGVVWAIRKRWRAPLAAWLFFCGTLFPVLGFLNVYYFIFSFVADHFQYLASLGIIVLVASAMARGLARLPQNAGYVGTVIPMLLIGVFALVSWRQCHLYADSITLYEATLKQNPDCWMVHNNLGLELAEKKGSHQDAMEHYRTALRLRSDYPQAHYNMGTELALLGRLPAAIDHFREAVRLTPDYLAAHHGLGNALVSAGRFPEAIAEYQAVLALKRNNPIALNNLSLALAQVGRTSEAIECLKESLRLEPEHVEAHNNLGLLLTRASSPKEAIPHLEFALKQRPDAADIHNNLADALRQAGRPNDAIEHYQAALRLKPGFVQVYPNLAQAFADVNRSQEAITTAQRGIELAQSTGQQELMKQLQQWLAQYQAKLAHGAANGAPTQSPPPARE